ncbi:MAG: DUF5689 domain-containing protein [Chitinophagaceae bacterium]
MKQLRYATLLLSITVLLASCLKKKFDNPPDTTTIDPNLPVTHSIWNFKSLYKGSPLLIEDDITIAGVVVADDRSGNLYKQIILQDTSSGIAVLIGRSGLYTDYPIGRKIYIKCKGLYLGEYNGFIQLGAKPDNSGSLSDIPSALISQYLVKGKFDLNQVTARKVSISDIATQNQINVKWIGTLLELDSVQFTGAYANAPYSEPNSGTSIDLEDCSGLLMIVRTSNFANFRAANTPLGRGGMKAVLTVYNSDMQLLLRDTNDVANMKGQRCGFGTGSEPVLTIAEVRDLFSTGTTTLTNVRVRGTVISDYDNDNVSSNRNMFMQQGDRGIVIRFKSSSDNYVRLGDSIEIFIANSTLSEFSGLLQIGDQVTSSSVLRVGKGTVVPRLATLADIETNFEAWESTLVTVQNVTMTPANLTYYSVGASYMPIDDGSTQGTLDHYTSSYASFKDEIVPTTPKTLTGILFENGTAAKRHIAIRNLNDVK